jgi:hypothetical protein
MRNGAVVLFIVPIIAMLLFGASAAWHRLEVIDPVMTGSIRR